MATLNFPDAPDTGDIYFDSNSGFTYEWNGTVWISRDPSTIPNIKELDNISSSFNGSTATFNLTVSSVAVTPVNAQQLVINIGNVMQNPGDDYTVSGSTITFTTAPTAGLVFQGTLLGSGVSLGTVEDGSVSPSSLDTSDSYNVGGITVTGITTVTDFTISGITTVANLEPADVNVSGIGTVSNIIMTKDAAGLGATVGAAVGVVTYYGDGSNLTGLGLTFFPISYDPGISSTSQPVNTNIVTNWNHPIKAGSGTITLRDGSASGTIIDQFVVGSSSSITFANNQLTLNPAADLSKSQTVFVTYPAGSIKSYGDKYQNEQLIYSFSTVPVQLWAWGTNYSAELGLNDRGNYYSSPTQIPGTSWANLVSSSFTLGTKTDGTLWAWGSNNSGTLGLNSGGSVPEGGVWRSSPTQVGTDTTWGTEAKDMANVDTSAFAIKTDGTLWGWGAGYYGSLGLNQGATMKISSPMQIGTDTTWNKISGQMHTIFGIKTDGTAWSWGANGTNSNAYGKLGLNDIADRSSPTQISGTTWSQISANKNATYAIKTDGTLWAWGSGNNGALGTNQGWDLGGGNYNRKSSPVQVGTDTTWSILPKSPRDGTNGMTALKTDGTLWSWGASHWGALGLNIAYPGGTVSSPTQVGTETTWADIQAGRANRLATKTDGTLWSWGYNGKGFLGQNIGGQPGNRSSPTQVGSDTTWITSPLQSYTYNSIFAKKEG